MLPNSRQCLEMAVFKTLSSRQDDLYTTQAVEQPNCSQQILVADRPAWSPCNGMAASSNVSSWPNMKIDPLIPLLHLTFLEEIPLQLPILELNCIKVQNWAKTLVSIRSCVSILALTAAFLLRSSGKLDPS